MELVCHKKIEYKTYVHDFENGFLYVQNWQNNRLKDDFFVHSGDLYPDGSIRPNKKKYFYSRFKGEDVKKEIGIVKISKFKWFDNLYYINDYGEVRSINEEIQKIVSDQTWEQAMDKVENQVLDIQLNEVLNQEN